MGVKRLTAEQFKDYIYNKMPEYHRQMDKKTDYHLQKFLDTLHEGAFNYTIEEANGILDIIDPDRTPSAVLPILFRSYGLEIFHGLPEPYSRMLLSIIGFLWGYKGTEMAVRYLVSLLAEVKVTVDTDNSSALFGKGVFDEMIFGVSYPVSVRLDMDSRLDGTGKFPDRESLMRIIKEFIPFYCSTTIIYTYFFHDDMNLKSVEIYHDHIIMSTNEDTVVFNAVGALKPTNAVFNGSEYGEPGAGSAVFGQMVFGDEDFMETDYTFDEVTMVDNEVARINMDADELEEDMVMAVLHDIARTRGRETMIDSLVDKKEDSGAFNIMGDLKPDSAVFNSDVNNRSGLFGELIFGNGDYVPADDFKDVIKSTTEDVAVIPRKFIGHESAFFGIGGMMGFMIMGEEHLYSEIDGDNSYLIHKKDYEAGTLSGNDYTVNKITTPTAQNALLRIGRLGSMLMGDESYSTTTLIT